MSVSKVLHSGEQLVNRHFHQDYKIFDSIHIKGSDVEVICISAVNDQDQLIHSDLIQIIPTEEGKSNRQYALACINNVFISDVHLRANGNTQGIFMGDGLISNLCIHNSIIETQFHPITIAGMLSGSIGNNTITNGEVLLLPARISNINPDEQVHILSFADTVQYSEIYVEGDQKVRDERTTPQKKGINLINFSLTDFKKAVDELPEMSGIEASTTYSKLALSFGDVYMGDVKYATPMEQQPKNKRTRELLDVLREEVYTREIAGPNHNPDVLKYWSATWYAPNNDDEAWCAAFMNWALREAGLPYTGSPRALDFLNWGIPATKREPGCMMVRDYGNGRGHVAVLLSETDTHYQIIGGNQSNQVGVDWWPKTGVWHCRRLKKPMMSKTAIFTFLEGLGLTGAGTTVVTDAVTTSEQLPNGESVEVTPTPVPPTRPTTESTEASTTPPASYGVPEGYVLVHENTIGTLGVILIVYIVVSLIFKVIIFRDRLKNIFKYGV